ncbi:Serine phosphatase RsbU, regulator of sigma subunit [Streptomyces aidingensis]|uniref:Serine phosphatase RsbU, regulator of sigma subunit n=1 Tax=Streptomyces aidingensis TaxID=910347 RepID=A0A1I1TU78_9ACTN|nr:Serine phosphatase RsbU, regulator of sigma subunit [Streptomyces aidingensis]
MAGAALDIATPDHLTFTPFFAAAPMTAAAVRSFRGTLFVGIVSTLAMAVLLIVWDRLPAEQEMLATATVGTVSVLALFTNLLVTERTRQAASARAVAEAVQHAVVPDPPARAGPLAIAARYRAAENDALIGGDLYAVVRNRHGVRLMVGDVRGKGLGATETVAVLLGTFHEAADEAADLPELEQRLESTLSREHGRRPTLDGLEGFVTGVLAELPTAGDGPLRVLNRGHPPPLLLTPGGEVRVLRPSAETPPFGLGDLAVAPARADPVDFPPDATLLLYTDGLSETRNAEGRFYDPAEALRGKAFPGPEELLDWLLADTRRYAGGGAPDDMALLAVRHDPGPV